VLDVKILLSNSHGVATVSTIDKFSGAPRRRSPSGQVQMRGPKNWGWCHSGVYLV